MIRRALLITAASAALFALAFGGLASGDVVFFKDEAKKPLEGKVFEKDGKKYIRTVDGREVELDPAAVDRIVPDKSLLDIYFEKLAALDAEDLEALFDLAMWCEKVGLDDKAAVLLLDILKRDPDNVRVHEYLGHVFRNGRWVVPGEEGFGDDIPNTLKKGEFVNHEGKYFVVRTDTSPRFAEYTSDFLDRFCRAVMDHFAGELRISMGKPKPVVIILADYDEYTQVFKDFVQKVIPEKRRFILRPRKEEYVPSPFTCFLDPGEFRLVAYRYKKGKDRPPLRENIRKLAGYGIYIFGVGGYRNIYKSPRFLCEGFAGYLSQAHLEGERLAAGEISERMRRRILDLEDVRIKTLAGIDPLLYYKEDTSAHSALSLAFAHFMLQGGKRGLRRKYFILLKKDASGGARLDFLRRILGPFDALEKALQRHIAGL